MPNVSGRDAAGFRQVEEFLRDIYELGDHYAPGDLIGISQEAAALELMKSGLASNFMAAITEDADGLWKSQLTDRARYSFRSASSKQMSLAGHNGVDVLIVTAMDLEFAPYYDLFELSEDSIFPGVYHFVFQDKDAQMRNGIGYSIGRSGQPSAASRTQSLISWFRPKVAFMSGYCGGVAKKVNLGDLCFFESAAPWDYGKWTEKRDAKGNLLSEEFLSRPNALPIQDSQLQSVARKLVTMRGDLSSAEARTIRKLSPKDDLLPEFILTPAASGSAVVANDSVISQIVGLNDSIRAVDMESYGFYDACINTFVAKPKFMCLKSVSDFCNGEKGDDFHEVCCYVSAVTTQRLLLHHVGF